MSVTSLARNGNLICLLVACAGGVIAVGLLVPFAGFNNWLEARIDALFGISTGLLISGSIWLLIAAYMIRF
ncbi:MAG: hypothetical protein P8P65_01105, partial [Planktotalea sp.]|nr:hypothetical protein [Planktotalea sp.]